MPGILSKISSKTITESAPKCPLITEREKFSFWLDLFKRYAYGLAVEKYLFTEVPKPVMARIGKNRFAKFKKAEEDWEDGRRTAFMALSLALQNNHEDVFHDSDFDP